MTAPSDAPTAPAAPAHPRCPRCGARLGRLAADPAPGAPGDAHGDAYCGCCGLVLPGGPPAGGAPAGR